MKKNKTISVEEIVEINREILSLVDKRITRVEKRLEVLDSLVAMVSDVHSVIVAGGYTPNTKLYEQIELQIAKLDTRIGKLERRVK